jgi:hypothetical protein
MKNALRHAMLASALVMISMSTAFAYSPTLYINKALFCFSDTDYYIWGDSAAPNSNVHSVEYLWNGSSYGEIWSGDVATTDGNGAWDYYNSLAPAYAGSYIGQVTIAGNTSNPVGYYSGPCE